MNTVVFVLMMFSYGGYSVATLEFSTIEKCERAVVDIQQQANARKSFLAGDMKAPWCARIEK